MGYVDESEELYYGKFRTYKITKGDTLQSVAKKLKVDSRELRRYHNMNCKIADLIEADFKAYLRFLILAEEKSEIASNDIITKKAQKATFGNNNKLPFLARGISKDYSVKYNFENAGQVDKMEMAVRIKWIATDTNKYSLFEIKRSLNLFIDENEPDRMFDELGAKIVEVLYPLEIVVDDNGKWIDVYNYDEIVSRWESKKTEIFEYYRKDSRVLEELIKFTEYTLTSSDKLFEMLGSDYFLRSFFNGIHTRYSTDYLCNLEVAFPLEKNVKSIFEIEQKVNPYLNDHHLIEVEQNGNYLNLEEGIGFSGKIWDGRYHAKYCLNANSYFMERMNLECVVEYDETIKINLIVETLKKEETH